MFAMTMAIRHWKMLSLTQLDHRPTLQVTVASDQGHELLGPAAREIPTAISRDRKQALLLHTMVVDVPDRNFNLSYLLRIAHREASGSEKRM